MAPSYRVAFHTHPGNYNPDWAIAFRAVKVKHVYFVAETKGSLSSIYPAQNLASSRLLLPPQRAMPCMRFAGLSATTCADSCERWYVWASRAFVRLMLLRLLQLKVMNCQKRYRCGSHGRASIMRTVLTWRRDTAINSSTPCSRSTQTSFPDVWLTVSPAPAWHAAPPARCGAPGQNGCQARRQIVQAALQQMAGHSAHGQVLVGLDVKHLVQRRPAGASARLDQQRVGIPFKRLIGR